MTDNLDSIVQKVKLPVGGNAGSRMGNSSAVTNQLAHLAQLAADLKNLAGRVGQRVPSSAPATAAGTTAAAAAAAGRGDVRHVLVSNARGGASESPGGLLPHEYWEASAQHKRLGAAHSPAPTEHGQDNASSESGSQQIPTAAIDHYAAAGSAKQETAQQRPTLLRFASRQPAQQAQQQQQSLPSMHQLPPAQQAQQQRSTQQAPLSQQEEVLPRQHQQPPQRQSQPSEAPSSAQMLHCPQSARAVQQHGLLAMPSKFQDVLLNDGSQSQTDDGRQSQKGLSSDQQAHTVQSMRPSTSSSMRGQQLSLAAAASVAAASAVDTQRLLRTTLLQTPQQTSLPATRDDDSIRSPQSMRVAHGTALRDATHAAAMLSQLPAGSGGSLRSAPSQLDDLRLPPTYIKALVSALT